MSSEAKIRVIIKRPDEKAGHVTYMSNTLRAFQKAVGGYIEVVRAGDIAIVVNEEGKIRGLEKNFLLSRYDVICGTAVICGVDGEEFTDLPEGFNLDVWRKTLDMWGNVI